jgi:predicted RNA-binding Zn ribbon-like protein
VPNRVPLTGQPLALDLINTNAASIDFLAGVDDLRSWIHLQGDRLAEAGAPSTEITAADLVKVHAVRVAVTNAVDDVRRGTMPATEDLEVLNQAQRAAPAIKELTATDGLVTTAHKRTGTPGARLVAWLAEAAADLLSQSAVTTVRRCDAPDCVMLFLPAHPLRRWCSARCGNRIRVARHYQRHKDG